MVCTRCGIIGATPHTAADFPIAGLSRLRQPTGAGLRELIDQGCGGWLGAASEILELVRRNLPEFNQARARVP
jgi:hypothetical protein